LRGQVRPCDRGAPPGRNVGAGELDPHPVHQRPPAHAAREAGIPPALGRGRAGVAAEQGVRLRERRRQGPEGLTSTPARFEAPGLAGEGRVTDPLAPREVPLLTPQLPGTSGSVRVSEQDFRVEELALHKPCGEGGHLYLLVEKSGRTTPEGAREREVGYAGLKDKRAIAVQRFSLPVPPRSPDFLRRGAAASGAGWRVLSAGLHGNKLRPGHLRGNRFRVVVRGAVEGAVERAERICAELRSRGAPNLYGRQRFGQRGDN